MNELELQLKTINDRINKLEKEIERKEEDGIYDDALYQEIEKLEEERSELNAKL